MTSRRLTAYTLLLIVSIIWGVAGPVIKYTLGDFPPLIFLTYRFALSSIIAILAFSLAPPRLPKSSAALGRIGVYGVLTSTVALGLLFLGYDKTSSLTGTLISAASPIMVAIAGVVFLREHITHWEKVGIAIAFGGTVITILEPVFLGNGAMRAAGLEGNLLIFASLVVGVATAVLAKVILRDTVSPTALTHISFLIGFITMLPIALSFYSFAQIWQVIATAPLSAHLGVWFMALFSGTIAYSLYHKGQKTIEIGETALFTYLLPVFAAPFSLWWLGERLTLPFLVGAGIIAIGVVIAEYRKRQKAPVGKRRRQKRKKMLY